jgi:hypothetical protein
VEKYFDFSPCDLPPYMSALLLAAELGSNETENSFHAWLCVAFSFSSSFSFFFMPMFLACFSFFLFFLFQSIFVFLFLKNIFHWIVVLWFFSFMFMFGPWCIPICSFINQEIHGECAGRMYKRKWLLPLIENKCRQFYTSLVQNLY